MSMYKKVEVDDHTIFYLEPDKGKKNSKHLLFIHGLGSSSITWGDFPDALSEYFHTVAIDLIGFGQSEKPKAEYTIPYFSKFIKNFLKQEEIGINEDDKVSIIGHSLGGYIALEYAIENKEKVDKLVLIDSSGMLNKPTPLLERYLEAALKEGYFERLELTTKVFEDMLADKSRYIPSKGIAFARIMEGQHAKNAFKSAYDHSTKVRLDLQRLEQIKDIPCLIIWGKDDILIPMDHVEKFNDILKVVQVAKIDNAGHSPHAEKPTITYDIIKNFLTI
jgi:2-hydroxy-6-oxonona-2,4-dienedioate hydrolase